MSQQEKIEPREIRETGEGVASGGVKTPEGKLISRKNSMKHGLTASVISSFDDGVDFELLLQQWTEEIQPVGPLEEALLERLVINYVRMTRATKVERNFIESHINPPSVVKMYKDAAAAERYEKEMIIYRQNLASWDVKASSLPLLPYTDELKPSQPDEPEYELVPNLGEKRVFDKDALNMVSTLINRYYVASENRFYKALEVLHRVINDKPK